MLEINNQKKIDLAWKIKSVIYAKSQIQMNGFPQILILPEFSGGKIHINLGPFTSINIE